MEKLPKILLVDDEPLNLDYLEQELEDEEIEIFTASDGQVALQLVAEKSPDMIFLDIMMPVMDGFTVLQRLKAHSGWNSIPVVIISAANDMSSIVRGIELGAEDFLPKPFNPVILHARLKAGLEKKRLRDVEQSYLHSLERELEIGREIQSGFLPTTLPQPADWQIEACFQPAREVAGDFYDVFQLDDRHLVILLGDVTDKGVGSALFMALIRTLFRVLLTMGNSAGDGTNTVNLPPGRRLQQAAAQVNDYLVSVHASKMLATVFLGILDQVSGELFYINAGHDHPYLLRSGGIFTELIPTAPLVGAFDILEFPFSDVILMPGDKLVIYSDGITDAMNPAGEMYSRERWQELLSQPLPPSGLHADYLVGKIQEFISNAPQYDDISLLLVCRD